MLGDDGEVARAALAARVFSDDIARRWLEQLLHPRVAAALEGWRREQEAADPGALLVHEVPLLYEAGLADRYDGVVLIAAPDAVRRARMPERFDERAATQLPEAGQGRAPRSRVRQRRLARRARALGRGAGRPLARGMRRLAWFTAGLLVVVAVLYGLFGHKGREMLERREYPLRYPEIVRGHAQQYGLDPALLAAVIYSESRFRPHVRSPQGAIGLMQLLPSTAKGIATRTGGTKFVAADLDDPEMNVRYGSWYLRHLREHYAGPARTRRPSRWPPTTPA